MVNGATLEYSSMRREANLSAKHATQGLASILIYRRALMRCITNLAYKLKHIFQP